MQQQRSALEVDDLLHGVRIPSLWSSLREGKEEEMVVALPPRLIEDIQSIDSEQITHPLSMVSAESRIHLIFFFQ
jgi:hypothetical protein